MCERVGFRVFMDEDLDKAKSHFDQHRHQVRLRRGAASGPHAALQRSRRHAGRAGRHHEDRAAHAHQDPSAHRGAGALRMDHYQVLVPDVLANAKFYMDLGFRISDYLYVEAAQRRGRHLPAPQEQPVGHRAPDALRPSLPSWRLSWSKRSRTSCAPATSPATSASATGIEHGPGRHGHQHSYYLYVRDPDGHRTELLLPGIQIIDIDDGPVMCPVKRQCELESVGPARAEKLGRGGDELRQCHDQKAAGRRLADDRGAVSVGEET